MNLLETLLDSSSGGSGAAIGQLAKKFGLPESVAQQAVGALTPALSKGLQRNVSQPGGLDSLLGALKSGGHQRYVEEPETLDSEATITDGNAILGHILGSKDVSRNVASLASQQTGLDSAILKQMLPMVGAMIMGSLAKKTGGGSQLSGLTGGGGGGGDPLSMLTGFLDADKDGSPTDDILNIAKNLFK